MATVTDLAAQTGITPLDHLDLEVEIPVLDGPQSQGDVRIRRLGTIPAVTVREDAEWAEVPPAGITVVDGGDGGHAHVLTPCLGAAEPVWWTTDVDDTEDLAVGAVKAEEPCYLYHQEHGGTGLAPGVRVIRRQREQADMQRRLVAD